MRTPPRLEDLATWLRLRVNALAVAHRAANPGTALCLIWGHRTPEEQQRAYAAKRSKLNGKTRFSLHNYMPALAADLWVYTEAADDVFYENRPPRDAGLELQLMQKGSLKNWYIPMAYLAEMEGLEAGALWRTFRDGPHVQVPKRQRIVMLQSALAYNGYDVGGCDGILGRKTRKAISGAKIESGIRHDSRGPMPAHPDLWKWLHRLPARSIV